jgi:hypothetical protein
MDIPGNACDLAYTYRIYVVAFYTMCFTDLGLLATLGYIYSLPVRQARNLPAASFRCPPHNQSSCIDAQRNMLGTPRKK